MLAVEQAAKLANAGRQFAHVNAAHDPGNHGRRARLVGRRTHRAAAHGNRLDLLQRHDRARAGRLGHEAAIGNNAAIRHAGLADRADAHHRVIFAQPLSKRARSRHGVATQQVARRHNPHTRTIDLKVAPVGSLTFQHQQIIAGPT